MADQAVTLCPICKSDCDITEEDLIDADCGACGNAISSCSFFPLCACAVAHVSAFHGCLPSRRAVELFSPVAVQPTGQLEHAAGK